MGLRRYERAVGDAVPPHSTENSEKPELFAFPLAIQPLHVRNYSLNSPEQNVRTPK
jgi:hypothetical protein